MRCVFAAGAAAVAVASSLSSAQFVTVDPGLFTNIEDRFEARIRLDGGNSQTWKTAIWEDTTLLATSGNVQNFFASGVEKDFDLSYDALSGLVSLTVGDRVVSTNITLTPGTQLAGFRIFATSQAGLGSSFINDLTAGADAGSLAIPDFGSDTADGFVDGPTYYLTSASDSISLSGDAVFAWLAGANLQGERYKVSIKVLEGVLVPAPGPLALAGIGGLIALRRKR